MGSGWLGRVCIQCDPEVRTYTRGRGEAKTVASLQTAIRIATAHSSGVAWLSLSEAFGMHVHIGEGGFMQWQALQMEQ